MPIRPELRHFYTGPGWEGARRRILLRAGGEFDLLGNYLGGAKCEACGKPDRTRVETFTNRTIGLLGHKGLPVMFWRTAASPWRDFEGTEREATISFGEKIRVITVVLAVVHLNHKAGDDRDENLRAFCQWCHLNWDVENHRESRSTRKDRARPLLYEWTGPVPKEWMA